MALKLYKILTYPCFGQMGDM